MNCVNNNEELDALGEVEKFKMLWIGGALSLMEQLCINSFIEFGQNIEVFSYEKLPNLPAGAIRRDASDILPKTEVFTYRKGEGRGSLAAFSNVFRYALLSKEGGIWVDADVLLLRPPVLDQPIAIARQDEKIVNSAIMKFPADHQAINWCLEESLAAGKDVEWGEIGPSLLTKAVKKFDLHRYIRAAKDFYPIGYKDWHLLVREDAREEVEVSTSSSTFLHLWNEMFRRAGIDKNACPPAKSFLGERIMALYSDKVSEIYIQADGAGRLLLQKRNYTSKAILPSTAIMDSSGRDRRYNEHNFACVALAALSSIYSSPGNPFSISIESKKRGIDFYSASSLPRIMAEAIRIFVVGHGYVPNLAFPQTFNEKLLWSKFFLPFSATDFADKLQLDNWIPSGLSNAIKVPRKIWSSKIARLPQNHEIPAGSYFLKANHGSGMSEKVEFPISQSDRNRLEHKCAKWLAFNYGLSTGEWWYSTMERSIFLEIPIESNTWLDDWKFFVIHGRSEVVCRCKDRNTKTKIGFYSRDGSPLKTTLDSYPPLDDPSFVPSRFQDMQSVAEAIGNSFSFARVDLFIDSRGEIYLGEITACPNDAGLKFNPTDLDVYLGKIWDVRSFEAK